jgi:hypothetical protein
MSMTIRYKIVGGAEGEDLRVTEAEAREALGQVLERHKQHGCSVRDVGGDEYVVEDHSGDVVATYELMH